MISCIEGKKAIQPFPALCEKKKNINPSFSEFNLSHTQEREQPDLFSIPEIEPASVKNNKGLKN